MTETTSRVAHAGDSGGDLDPANYTPISASSGRRRRQPRRWWRRQVVKGGGRGGRSPNTSSLRGEAVFPAGRVGGATTERRAAAGRA
jgi:hypothetical protein